MSKKLPLRYERKWRWTDPPKLDSGFYNYRIEILEAASQRVNHFPGYGREDSFYEYEEEGETEDIPEYSGGLGSRESICLADVIKRVEEEGLDPKNVYFTASFSDDYLCLEVVNINKLDEAGQLEEYQEAYSKWAALKKNIQEDEKKRIQYEIKSLEKRLEALKDK